MTVTLEISPEREAAMRREAARRGLTVEAWLLQVAAEAAPVAAEPEAQDDPFADPEAWIERFDAFVKRYGVHANLPDEALTRESIYDDRGA
jgi:hypothetical protein